MFSFVPPQSLGMILRSTLVALVLTFAGWLAVPAAAQTQPVLLQMIRDDAVHRELDLSDAQRESIERTLREIDPPWFRSRNLNAEARSQVISEATQRLHKTLDAVLDANQRSRIEQLTRQAMGTRMFGQTDVVEALAITAPQSQALQTIYTETDKKAAAAAKDGQEMSMSEITAQERERVLKVLTDEQQQRIGSITGDPFNFALVKRTYPLAPPLQSEGAQWLQGSPVDLDSLKGKVVAVHFYAFQCINCQRNLPHYNGWHTDYADDGLVVIGIQTPETPSERDPDRVAAAAKSEAMQYPVMLDGDSKNWQAWSNTMWPTVYLIDKKGYLRRWWQGEMNWQGTPGEKQMRETIEQLLAEEA